MCTKLRKSLITLILYNSQLQKKSVLRVYFDVLNPQKLKKLHAGCYYKFVFSAFPPMPPRNIIRWIMFLGYLLTVPNESGFAQMSLTTARAPAGATHNTASRTATWLRMAPASALPHHGTRTIAPRSMHLLIPPCQIHCILRCYVSVDQRLTCHHTPVQLTFVN